MEWTPGGISEDIEDHRDDSGGGGFSGFGGFGGGHLGIGGVLILGLLSLIFGRNFFTLFSGDGSGTRQVQRAPDRQRDAAEGTEVQFVSFVQVSRPRPDSERHARRELEGGRAAGTEDAARGRYCPPETRRAQEGRA